LVVDLEAALTGLPLAELEAAVAAHFAGRTGALLAITPADFAAAVRQAASAAGVAA
jgi:hypothetical protein